MTAKPPGVAGIPSPNGLHEPAPASPVRRLFSCLFFGVEALVRVAFGFAIGAIVVWLLYHVAWPAASEAITRHRLSGTWHLDGSFADWRFGSDGSWTEDALIDTRGSYTLLDQHRIRIKGMLGATMEFRYSFEESDLLLRGDNGTPFSFRLTRKN